MKKLLVVLVFALVVATAVWVAMRIQMAKRLAVVPELLPQATLLLVELSDFQRARTRWHESDLYQIWREPAVQAWLQKPLAHLPKKGSGHKIMEDFLQLGPTRGFLALTSIESNEPKLIGGFHFDQSPAEARKFVEQLETNFLAKTADTKRETMLYEQHEIETVSVSHFVFARVYDNQWLFASNDIATLKALLDRADHRRKKGDGSLQESEAFAAAAKHLPAEYAGMIFLDPRPFVEKLMPLVAMTGQSLPMDQLQRLRQVRSMVAVVGFDHGKMRETDFVAMPKVGADEKLKRPLLGTAGADTFLYSASRVHWSDNLLTPSAPAAIGLPALVRQFIAAMSARGISLDDLRTAFGEEFEIVGDWPAHAQWPTLVAALPVKDTAGGRKIADALTSVEISGAAWTRNDKNGATLYSLRSFGGFLPVLVSPTIAVSERMMIAGSDTGAVETVLNRIAQPAGELEKSAIFRDATGQVPPADSAFNYVDTRLFFERADAAARPLLLMGAALFPGLAQTVDFSKWPAPEAIAKHLSPIVMSQRYDDDGYVTESVGPVTFREATIGLAVAVGGLFIYLQDGLKSRDLLPTGPTNPVMVPVAPSASPSPSSL
jgi:hypothetical protein